MALTESRTSAGTFAKFSDWVHRNLLWLLVVSYVLAALFPGPGQKIRGFTLSGATGDQVTAPMLLLALLLFCAAAVVRWSQLRELMQRPGVLLLGLIAIWLVPSLFVSALGWALPAMFGAKATSGMLVGLALAAAMPVANSSVAWCQNAQGNVALSLGFIVLTIVLSPVAAPQMLNLMGLSLSPTETAQCQQLVTRFSGAFFIVWVILPSMAGMAFNWLFGLELIDRLRGLLRMVSAATLLTLNYANASLAMPQALEEGVSKTFLLSSVLAIALSALGVSSGWILSRLLDSDRPTAIALMFGFSMKHTGLALVLAGQVLHTEPRVILMIVLATLLQHVVAGVADWYVAHRGESDG
ncbi:MAG: bile acid:sodium symporter [Planctomycetota bacterium]